MPEYHFLFIISILCIITLMISVRIAYVSLITKNMNINNTNKSLNQEISNNTYIMWNIIFTGIPLGIALGLITGLSKTPVVGAIITGVFSTFVPLAGIINSKMHEKRIFDNIIVLLFISCLVLSFIPSMFLGIFNRKTHLIHPTRSATNKIIDFEIKSDSYRNKQKYSNNTQDLMNIITDINDDVRKNKFTNVSIKAYCLFKSYGYGAITLLNKDTQNIIKSNGIIFDETQNKQELKDEGDNKSKTKDYFCNLEAESTINNTSRFLNIIDESIDDITSPNPKHPEKDKLFISTIIYISEYITKYIADNLNYRQNKITLNKIKTLISATEKIDINKPTIDEIKAYCGNISLIIRNLDQLNCITGETR